MDLMENEIAKPIKDFEGKYYITNFGRVWSTRGAGRWLKPTENKQGNHVKLYVSLGRRNKRYVHRLVAEAFIPNPNNLPEVDHIDTNGANNHVDNLRWVTHEQNMHNEITKEVVKSNTGWLNQIEYIPTGEKFWGCEEAAKNKGVSKATVLKHLRNGVQEPKWRKTGQKKNPKTEEVRALD